MSSSRPTSSRSKKGGKKGKKEKPKTPKQMVKELTEQNEILTNELTTLKNEADEMRTKIMHVSQKIVSGLNAKEVQKAYGVKPETDPMTVGTDILMDILGKLIVKKRIQEVSVEARVEDLETRVTEMSLDIAKMTKKTFAYETGLAEIAEMNDIEQIRDKLFELQLIAGQEYHIFTSTDPIYDDNFPIMNGVEERPSSAVTRSLEKAKKLNLIPPLKRMAGETHINKMHKELRMFLISELSIQKQSGADWRMMAERVGISDETIEYWKSLELQNPMGRVFGEWGESDGATIRMLHRHLMSPQMRNTILGKRIADFYDVD